MLINPLASRRRVKAAMATARQGAFRPKRVNKTLRVIVKIMCLTGVQIGGKFLSTGLLPWLITEKKETDNGYDS
jgi:hypothetical protein